jgi:hypothetical protein
MKAVNKDLELESEHDSTGKSPWLSFHSNKLLRIKVAIVIISLQSQGVARARKSPSFLTPGHPFVSLFPLF